MTQQSVVTFLLEVWIVSPLQLTITTLINFVLVLSVFTRISVVLYRRRVFSSCFACLLEYQTKTDSKYNQNPQFHVTKKRAWKMLNFIDNTVLYLRGANVFISNTRFCVQLNPSFIFLSGNVAGLRM